MKPQTARERYTGTFFNVDVVAKYQESSGINCRRGQTLEGTRLMSKKTLKAAFMMFFDLNIAIEKNHPKRLAQ